MELNFFLLFFCGFIKIIINADCGCNLGRSGNIFIEEAKLTEINYKFQDEIFYEEMSLIPGGEYQIGDEENFFPEDNENARIVFLKDFYIDKYEVSNREFQKFVLETNFTTEAEKFGDSFIFKSLLSEEMRKKYIDFRVLNAEWWFKIPNGSWHNPYGFSSRLDDIIDHPVVHVSWNDAVSFCKWAKKRLPTEEEWEVACRGGKKGKLFPWGNKHMPKNKHWMNIWQGQFPDGNTMEDGYLLTCPVKHFQQNKYGLHNMVGNVWEWTQSLWSPKNKNTNLKRVKKGGSYLCHKSYCYRYRCASRSHNTADSSAGNLGFRCARDL